MTNDGIMYSSTFIDDLKRNWITKTAAMTLLKLKKSGLFYFLKTNGIRGILLGKTGLYPERAVLDAMKKRVRISPSSGRFSGRRAEKSEVSCV